MMPANRAFLFMVMSMTAQEIFDKTVKHLLSQNCRSQVKGSCKYRGPNGTMCAIGCLIPDEKYCESMEDIRVGKLIDSGILLHFREHKKLLSELQFVHDFYSITEWETELKSIANEFMLAWNYVSE